MHATVAFISACILCTGIVCQTTFKDQRFGYLPLVLGVIGIVGSFLHRWYEVSVFQEEVDRLTMPSVRSDEPAVFVGSCALGQSRHCYNGPRETMDVGICQLGYQDCVDGSWSICFSDVRPTTEIPGNEIDEDCDGFDQIGNDETQLAYLLRQVGVELLSSWRWISWQRYRFARWPSSYRE